MCNCWYRWVYEKYEFLSSCGWNPIKWIETIAHISDTATGEER